MSFISTVFPKSFDPIYVVNTIYKLGQDILEPLTSKTFRDHLVIFPILRILVMLQIWIWHSNFTSQMFMGMLIKIR